MLPLFLGLERFQHLFHDFIIGGSAFTGVEVL